MASSAFEVPYGQDELGIAGALGVEPVPVVRCKTVDLEVPATAEIVLEAVVEVDPSQWRDEGPFV